MTTTLPDARVLDALVWYALTSTHARFAELSEGRQGVVDQAGDVARVHLPSPDHPHGHPELPDPGLEHVNAERRQLIGCGKDV